MRMVERPLERPGEGNVRHLDEYPSGNVSEFCQIEVYGLGKERCLCDSRRRPTRKGGVAAERRDRAGQRRAGRNSKGRH